MGNSEKDIKKKFSSTVTNKENFRFDKKELQFIESNVSRRCYPVRRSIGIVVKVALN